MASSIDPTKPEQGLATTLSVRENFAACKAEIEELQSKVGSAVSQKTTVEITPPAIAGGQTKLLAITLPYDGFTFSDFLCLGIVATTSSPTTGLQNYSLELFDGDPAGGGIIVYQATGISVTPYTDGSPWFLMPVDTFGSIWARITNIDADDIVVTLNIRWMGVT